MMTVASSPISPGNEQHLLLEDVSWESYEQLLHEIGDRPLRVTFDSGSLEVMSPLHEHETWKTWIGFMVEALSVELDIPIRPLGSSTFRRKDLLKGLEPDECYYVQHAPDLAGKAQVDLAVDPPPDLAIEIEMTRRSIQRHPIYSALGISELWTFGKSRLRVLHLSLGGKYREATTSKAFPFLPMDQFEAFLLRLGTERPTAVLREYRVWLTTLKPLPMISLAGRHCQSGIMRSWVRSFPRSRMPISSIWCCMTCHGSSTSSYSERLAIARSA